MKDKWTIIGSIIGFLIGYIGLAFILDVSFLPFQRPDGMWIFGNWIYKLLTAGLIGGIIGYLIMIKYIGD